MNTQSNNEFPAVIGVASIFAIRMLGLFMVLPVLSTYARHLMAATPTQVGIAVGIYGLSQACLQILFGSLSDRLGRRPVIVFGLFIFMLGSAFAAISDSISGLIFARALQGAGAIGSTLIATLADLSSEKNRTRAMAILGMSIGLSFALAMLLGPLLSQHIGVHGLFWLTAVLAVFAIIITFAVVPEPAATTPTTQVSWLASFAVVLRHSELWRLNIGIFVQHAMLTALFVALPILLKDHFGLATGQHWQIYLPIMGISFFLLVPLAIYAEKQGYTQTILRTAISLAAIGQLGLYFGQAQWLYFLLFLFVYFAAFNCLEALLPSLVSKAAPTHLKGTATGVYSTCQFLGIFAGGTLGGLLYGNYSAASVFLVGAFMALVWLLSTSPMPQKQQKSSVCSAKAQ